MDLKTLFTEAQKTALSEAIALAERQCRGELRIHIDKSCRGSVMEKAVKVFNKLGMHKTAERSGVLIYVAFKDRKLAIIGDSGINAVVGAEFWDQALGTMKARFKEGLLYEGLMEGIRMAGEQLALHFPGTQSDENELSNDISYGN